MHKYLNDLGVKSDEICIFNTENKDDNAERWQRFQEERKEHTFDSRETWSMDYTSATWVYEHLKMYKDLAGLIPEKHGVKMINLHRFSVPVLYEIPDIGKRYSHGFLEAYYKEVFETKTLEEAIDLILGYLEYYILNQDYYTKEYNDLYDEQIEACKLGECLQCAFKIYAIILENLWW